MVPIDSHVTTHPACRLTEAAFCLAMSTLETSSPKSWSTSPLQVRNHALSPTCSQVSTYSAIFINILVGSVLSTSPGGGKGEDREGRGREERGGEEREGEGGEERGGEGGKGGEEREGREGRRGREGRGGEGGKGGEEREGREGRRGREGRGGEGGKGGEEREGREGRMDEREGGVRGGGEWSEKVEIHVHVHCSMGK